MKKLVLGLVIWSMALCLFVGCSTNKEMEINKSLQESIEIVSNNIRNLYEEKQIGLTSVKNARELGGYETSDGKIIKHNVLIRTGDLSKLSDDDARGLKDKYNLKKIFDLRSSYEASSSPDKIIDGVSYTRLDLINNDIVQQTVDKAKSQKITGDEKIDLAIAYYFNRSDDNNPNDEILFSEHAIAGYNMIFNSLLENDGATLFHCTAGKDRTGHVAALLLTALGVDRETILDDYEASNVAYESDMKYIIETLENKGYNHDDIINIAKIVGVDRHCLENSLNTIDGRYGSVENYIREAIGISDEQINKLREKYLEN